MGYGLTLMGWFVSQFVFFACETSTMAASNKKADVLFALNVLSDNFFDKEDSDAYGAVIENILRKAGMKRRQTQIMKKVCIPTIVAPSHG